MKMKEKLQWINITHKNHWLLILIGVLKSVSQLLNVGFVWLLIKSVMNLVNGNYSDLWYFLIFFSGIMAMKAAVIFFEGYVHGKASGRIKVLIKSKILDHVEMLGPNHQDLVDKALLTQLSNEGVEQLDLYYTLFIPQMIYGTITPIIVLMIMSLISVHVAIILFIAVPLIPLLIIAINRKAKMKLGKYWNSYSDLGGTFFDFLCGINTIKVFNADGSFNDELNEKAESFRISTMKVLKMQLNSITIMDIVAYGGAALAIVMLAHSVLSLGENITLALFGIMLSADFFLPLRSLGSAFHVATNGIAAFDKMKAFLDISFANKETKEKIKNKEMGFVFQHVTVEMGKTKILDDISMEIMPRKLTAIVGVSGSGKTTSGKLMTRSYVQSSGQVLCNGISLDKIDESDLSSKVFYVNVDDYLIGGTIRDILSHGYFPLTDEQIWDALERVNLKDFVDNKEKGLDFVIEKNANNISGGQKERLIFAKALLVDAPVYVFDEPTSSIDYENEELIVGLIYRLAQKKTVVYITHKLLTINKADNIYFMSKGKVLGQGNHQELYDELELYRRLYDEQRQLDDWRRK